MGEGLGVVMGPEGCRSLLHEWDALSELVVLLTMCVQVIVKLTDRPCRYFPEETVHRLLFGLQRCLGRRQHGRDRRATAIDQRGQWCNLPGQESAQVADGLAGWPCQHARCIAKEPLWGRCPTHTVRWRHCHR